MGLMGKLLGGNVIEQIGNAIDKVTTTDEERAAAEIIKARLQTDLNAVEAQHRSLFIAGWRPAIGWICVLGLLIEFIINPILALAFGIVGPSANESLMELVLGMLGLAGLRTFEKYKGNSK